MGTESSFLKEMKFSAALFASCSAVLSPYVAPGDGMKCFLGCQKTMMEVYARCSLEWGYGTEEFNRCYDGAEDEMVRCYVEDCPQDACSKVCGAPVKDGYTVCEGLYSSGQIDTIGYTICMNKVFLDMLECFEGCYCGLNEANGVCTCHPINPPYGLETFAPKWVVCVPME